MGRYTFRYWSDQRGQCYRVLDPYGNEVCRYPFKRELDRGAAYTDAKLEAERRTREAQLWRA